jgi:hypothetical protein
MYLRWGFVLAYLGCLAYAAWQVRPLPWKRERRYWPLGRCAVLLLLGLFGLVQIGRGFRYEGEPIRLHFPLKHGTYFVMQGGGSVALNLFHGSYSWRQYGYALDLGKLNAFGSRARHVYSRRNADYAIYRDTVYAPIDAKVLYTLDTVPDNVPGTISIRPIEGNHVILQHGKYRIFLIHLATGGVFVRKGQKVKAGQPLGLQGNTGVSMEPHTHIHVWKDYGADLHSKGTSVPILFDGEGFMTLNEVVGRER